MTVQNLDSDNEFETEKDVQSKNMYFAKSIHQELLTEDGYIRENDEKIILEHSKQDQNMTFG